MRTLLLLLLLPTLAAAAPKRIAPGAEITSGALQVTRGDATYELPLLHTDVDAAISGLVADVAVTQTFDNPFDEPLEAVYLFPLPDESAVHAMTMRIGERTIVGEIKRREEAQRIYEEARDNGQAAALLDQERPNVFTQRVANILPGEPIEVTIEFAEVLQYEDGGYEWAMPLVVGPRYVPAEGTGEAVDDTASFLAPYSPETTGNPVTIAATIDAGVPVHAVRSPSHEIVVDEHDGPWVELHVDPRDDVPNKDFILRYEVAGQRPEVALITHRDGGDGYFLLMVQPPADEAIDPDEITPKDLVFVVDTSCSQSGAPMEAAKDAMRLAIDGMNPADRFEILRFSSSSVSLGMQDNTPANRQRALAFIDDFRGAGGTNMLPAVEAALDTPLEAGRLRTVVMMTDGYVGNERPILSAVQQRLGASRFFTLGTGSSTNRYLIDRLSRVGRGDAVYLRPDEDPEPVVQRMFERIDRPLLTGLEIEADGVELFDLTPDPLPDLFAGQPLLLVGRYEDAGVGSITLSGELAGEPWSTTIDVDLPASEPEHAALGQLWARHRIEELELEGHWDAVEDVDYTEAITELALEFSLMSDHTSFVAVEERVVNEDGRPKTVRVPLETPEFVDHGAIFGDSTVSGLVGSSSGYQLQKRSSAYGGSLSGSVGASTGIGGLGTRGRGVGGGGGRAYSGLMAESAEEVARPAPALAPLADPAPKAEPASSPEVVLGSIDSASVRTTVRRVKGRFQVCYERQLMADPSLAGKLVVEVVIGPDGRVVRVVADEDQVGSEALTSCVLSAVRRLRFPAGEGTATIRWPFVFVPNP